MNAPEQSPPPANPTVAEVIEGLRQAEADLAELIGRDIRPADA